MEKEINKIKRDLSEKQKILNSMNEEIEQILDDKKDELNIDYAKKISLKEKGRYLMLVKMKNRIKDAEMEIKKENYLNKNNKQNIKFTKLKELELERKIINEQKEKILLLIENNKEMEKKQKNELEECQIYNKNLKLQQKLIHNFKKKLQKLRDEENELQNEIIKYENFVNKTSNKVEIIKIRQVSLKSKNDKLKKESNEFNEKNKNENLDILKNKLSSQKGEYKYMQLRNQKTLKLLENIKIRYKNEKEISKEESEIKKSNISQNNESSNSEDNIDKLNQKYKKNKDKEEKLEKNISLFQDAIKKINDGEKVNIEEIKNKILEIINQKDEDGEININICNNTENDKNDIDNQNKDLFLSEDNPYFTDSEENDIINNNKFTNRQYREFTYILFKNFQAKKINHEKGKNQIIIPLMNYFNSIKGENENKKKDNILQEKLNQKFCEIIQKLLNCNNKNDIINLKIYFNCIYYEKVINSKNKKNNDNELKLMNDFFLLLFNNIHEFSKDEENILKNKIKSKYNNDFKKLLNLLKENNSENNKNNKNENNKKKDTIIKENKSNDYISFQKIKTILDKNQEIKLKDKYVEFILYYMKQFDDINASLFDLKISKINDILKEGINENNKNNDNNKNIKIKEKNKDKKYIKSNEQIDEIPLDEFNKNINSVLVVIKQLIEDEKKDLRKIFCNSIVQKTNPKREMIKLESLNDELNKRNIYLNNLQISCINQKYCINKEMNGLDINQIEDDINNFKIK